MSTVFLCVLLSAQGQEKETTSWFRLIPQEYSSLTAAEAAKIERLVGDGLYSDYWILDAYALQNIIQDEQLVFSLPGQRFEAKFAQNWLGDDGSGHLVWEGKTAAEDGYAILLMDERTVFGHINYQGEHYMLHSMEESNTSVLFKQSKIKGSGKGCEIEDHALLEDVPNEKEASSNERLGATGNCDVRVLVYFTQDAANSTANINQLAFTAIAQTNAAFSNSAISRNTVSLVSAGIELLANTPANWTGNNITADVNALISDQAIFPNGSANVTGANNRRLETGADLVVCLTDDDYPQNGSIVLAGFLGRRSAYAIVETPLAITGLVFAHEVGHLFDCRHAHGDPNGQSYARGHLYYGNDGLIYRSVVTAQWIFPPFDPTPDPSPIPYFSNPDVSFMGAPTGKSHRNNARRIRERACTVAGYVNSVETPLTAIIQGVGTGYYGSYHVFQADVAGGGPGAYSYQWRVSSTPFPTGSVQSTSFQLGTNLISTPIVSTIYIHLRVTSADGQVRNAVHPVVIWGGIGPPPPNRIGELSNLELYPNPANAKLMLSLASATAGQAKLQFVDALGKLVREETFFHHGESMRYKCNINDLPAGIYLVSLQIGEQQYTKKLVKAN
ncbi:MAG: zinc-dependent metalloprotease [Bacteroidota bacterium]